MYKEILLKLQTIIDIEYAKLLLKILAVDRQLTRRNLAQAQKECDNAIIAAENVIKRLKVVRSNIRDERLSGSKLADSEPVP